MKVFLIFSCLSILLNCLFISKRRHFGYSGKLNITNRIRRFVAGKLKLNAAFPLEDPNPNRLNHKTRRGGKRDKNKEDDAAQQVQIGQFHSDICKNTRRLATKIRPSMKSSRKDTGRVKVFVRIKPTTNENAEVVETKSDKLQLMIKCQKDPKFYKFDGIFPQNTVNYEIFEHVGKPVVLGALNGFNGTVFAYGQTGSGKTYSLMASDGITVNMVNKLFAKISHDRDHTCKVKFGYVQIYQEKVFDLLNDDSKLQLNIREDPATGMYIENLTEYVCHTPLDVFELLRMGQRKLIFAETKMNRRSSRSHAVCQVSVVRTRRRADDLSATQESTIDQRLKVRSPCKVGSSEIKKPASTTNRRSSLQPSSRRLRSRTRSEGQLKNLGTRDANDPLDWLRPASAVERDPDAKLGDTSFGYDGSYLDSSFSKFLQEHGEDEEISSVEKDVLLKGKINICDLAGSERIKTTGVEGERLQEAQHINLSLLELGNVIAALAEGNKTYIPYRNSLLTRLLQDSLGGNCKTTFLLCISQATKSVNETKSTLDFGQRALKVKTKPRVNVEMDYKRMYDDMKQKMQEQDTSYALLKEKYDELLSQQNSGTNDPTGSNSKDNDDSTKSLDNVDGIVFRTHECTDRSGGNDIEKARLLLVTQLMSLQLVYSVKDIAKIQSSSFSSAVESDENRNEERLDWLKTLQLSLSSLAYCRPNVAVPNTRSPPSSPSGYETASEHGSENDIRSPHGNSNDVNDAQDVFDDAPSFSNVCSPLLEKLRTPYGPRKSRILENLLGPNMLGINVDNYLAPSTVSKTVNDLRKELYQIKLNINTDILEFCKTYFCVEEPVLGKEHGLRDLCTTLMQKLSEPDAASTYSFEILEQASNLILLEHTLLGCLLALKNETQHCLTEQELCTPIDPEMNTAHMNPSNKTPAASFENLPMAPVKMPLNRKKRSRWQRFMCLPMKRPTRKGNSKE